MSLTTIHVILALALLYSQFCRAIKTDHNTKLPVLLAFYLLTAATVFVLFAPAVVPGWTPSIDTVALLFAVVVVQGVTAIHWRHGVPESFCGDQDSGKVG